MLTRIASDAKEYDWGSSTAIPELLGVEATGRPQAELWLGAHPDGVTRLVDAGVGAPTTLNEWVRNDPRSALGSNSRLPFLFKVLAAAKPLSLQAHPTLLQARLGFAEENARGIPRESPARNYKDEWHKPEMIVALDDGFEALCGFRPVARSRELLQHLSQYGDAEQSALVGAFHDLLTSDGLEKTVEGTLLDPPEGLVDALTVAAEKSADSRWAPETHLITTLARFYPGDVGIAVATLLNFVTLHKDEALYLTAGNIHAYVNGLAVEIMASSDNVLRGGLTHKSIDIPELLRVLDFTPTPVPAVVPGRKAGGYLEYEVPIPDFRLVRVYSTEPAMVELDQASIVFAARGGCVVVQQEESRSLQQGEALFVTPSDTPLSIRTDGTTFVASSGR